MNSENSHLGGSFIRGSLAHTIVHGEATADVSYHVLLDNALQLLGEEWVERRGRVSMHGYYV